MQTCEHILSFLSSVKIYTGTITLSRCLLPLSAFNKECSKLVRFPALEGSCQGCALRQLLLQDELLPQPDDHDNNDDGDNNDDDGDEDKPTS